MFKIFPGYDLVDAYHKWKKAHRTDDKTVSRAIRLIIAVVVALLVWCLPVENWIDGMTIIQKRTLAIFIFAILMWLFEAVPAWTTSVMVVVLLLFTTSNSKLVLFNSGVDSDYLKAYHSLTSEAKTIMDNQSEYSALIDVLKDSAETAQLKTLVSYVQKQDSYEAAAVAIQTDSLVIDGVLISDEVKELYNPSTAKLLTAKTITSLTTVIANKEVTPAEAFTPEVVGEISELGKQTSYKSLLACFADPIIMLFIGGFILAIAASKTGLDLFLARVMLKPFGKKPKWVLLGFLMVTGIFSMFLSNTATAAMMLTFLGPVLKALPADGKGKTALALAIPIAANVGGMGTPIGTPPNAIALKYMSEIGINIGFGQWMLFMIPFTLLLLFLAWIMLLKLFPFKAKEINLNIQGELKKDWRSIVVYITFIITVLLWVLDKATGVNANVVAMLPVGVCAIIGVLTKRDLEEISWSVLWMVAGGFALGVGLQETGLAQTLIDAIPFGSWPALVMVIGSGLICYAMANFISHTATASLLVPILAVVGASVAGNLAPLGGVSTLLVGVAIGSSLGMVLPISTPPNAIAASTGMIEQKEMVKTGLIMGILGLVLGYVMLIVLGSTGFFG
jgi:sodium-dependent dicarboxylate transporter 2/3/5